MEELDTPQPSHRARSAEEVRFEIIETMTDNRKEQPNSELQASWTKLSSYCIELYPSTMDHYRLSNHLNLLEQVVGCSAALAL